MTTPPTIATAAARVRAELDAHPSIRVLAITRTDLVELLTAVDLLDAQIADEPGHGVELHDDSCQCGRCRVADDDGEPVCGAEGCDAILGAPGDGEGFCATCLSAIADIESDACVARGEQ